MSADADRAKCLNCGLDSKFHVPAGGFCMPGAEIKRPSHHCPQYVVRRIRQLLAKRGWAISRTTGRYSVWPALHTQRTTDGYHVSRVGVSKSVAISWHGNVKREERQTLERAAYEYLRALGYRVDEKGWIECDFND